MINFLTKSVKKTNKQNSNSGEINYGKHNKGTYKEC